jgi:hypothetical protein
MAWLDANCGAEEWSLTSRMRGVLNDAVSI